MIVSYFGFWFWLLIVSGFCFRGYWFYWMVGLFFVVWICWCVCVIMCVIVLVLVFMFVK